MTTALTFLILITPFVAAAALSWAAHRGGTLRTGVSEQLMSRLFDFGGSTDCEAHRIEHYPDAIRTRFEQHPVWPASGACGERR